MEKFFRSRYASFVLVAVGLAVGLSVAAEYLQPLIATVGMIGLAFGKDPNVLGFGRELTDARAALSKIGFQVPEVVERAETRAARRSKKEGLPMPPPLQRVPEDEEADK